VPIPILFSLSAPKVTILKKMLKLPTKSNDKYPVMERIVDNACDYLFGSARKCAGYEGFSDV
jgi:hypothetical protein